MSTESLHLKRVKRKIKSCQNPLFEKWLKEWKAEAAKNGSDMQHCFNKALKSLQKFPVKLSTGKECLMLENFGAKICSMLDKRLEEHKAQHGEDFSIQAKTTNGSIGALGIHIKEVKSNETEKNTKKRKSSEVSPPRKKKPGTRDDLAGKDKYTPAYRSGGYAILVTLFEKTHGINYSGSMSKAELQKHAQDLCDSSFTKPQSGSNYTAWSSMATLIKKELVKKEGNPAKFSLTEKGTDVAIRLKLSKNCNNNDCVDVGEYAVRLSPSPQPELQANVDKPVKVKALSVKDKENGGRKSPVSGDKALSQVINEEKETQCVSEGDDVIFMLPGTFEIMLLVDTQERDNKCEQATNQAMRQLKSRNVNFEVRHLKVGDFIWIAKDSINGYELVLPYVVERKRMDDLASSIKDGRFHEQKFRLKQSGIENLIYLVEKYGNENQRLGLPLPTLQQAISNTQVVGDFTVKVTSNHDHSMRYLDIMTTQLSNIFKTKTLMSCKKANVSPLNLSDDLISLMTFKDFNKGSEKNKKLTVRSMLVKHLLQLNGISVEKAKAIVQLYPTPKALMEALKQSNGEKSIADLTFGGLNRSIGPATAKQIQLLYTSLNLS